MELIEALDKLAELEKLATPRPWTLHANEFECAVWASERMNVCEMRGWGYLAGIGRLDLIPEKAAEIQEANGQMVVARNILPELLECAKALAELYGLGKEVSREEFQRWTDARKYGRAALDALKKKLTGGKADGEGAA